MCPKIDVMERECKKLEVGRHLNKPQVYRGGDHITSDSEWP
jgi:hypothetical protein